MNFRVPIPTDHQSTAKAEILGGHIRDRRLNALDRLLMACDGTFTFQLEAIVGERIKVQILRYEQAFADPFVADALDLSAGASVMARAVLLVGAETQQPYVFAHSYVLLDGLPRDLREALETSAAGLGRLLFESRLALAREFQGYFLEDGEAYAPIFGARNKAAMLARSTRVSIDARWRLFVTERWPHPFEDPFRTT